MTLLELSSFSDEETACDSVFPPALPHPLPSTVWLVLDPTLPREGLVAAGRMLWEWGGGSGRAQGPCELRASGGTRGRPAPAAVWRSR